jgi:hypothetical protein
MMHLVIKGLLEEGSLTVGALSSSETGLNSDQERVNDSRDDCVRFIDISSQKPNKYIEEHHRIYEEFKHPPNHHK